MGYDPAVQSLELARNYSIDCQRQARERLELSERQPRTKAHRQTPEAQVLDLMRQLKEYQPEKVRARQRLKPHLSPDAAAYELVFEGDPDLARRVRAEQLSLDDRVGSENKPPTSAGPYPTTPRQTGSTAQGDLETRVRPDGVGSDLTPTSGGKPNVGRADSNPLKTKDSIELDANDATSEFEDRVQDLMRTNLDYAGNYAKAAGKIAADDPELYQRTQQASALVKSMA